MILFWHVKFERLEDLSCRCLAHTSHFRLGAPKRSQSLGRAEIIQGTSIDRSEMQTLGDVWMQEAEERKQRQAVWTNESSRQCPVHQSADVCGTAVCRPRKPLARVRRKATEHSQMFVGTIQGKPLGLFTLEFRPPKYLQDSSSVLKGRADSQLTPL